MLIIHRISLLLGDKQRAALVKLGLNAPDGSDGDLVSFDVDENHQRWAELVRLFEKWDALDVVSTEFSEEELSAASWLELRGEWHHGYPQPEAKFGFRRSTYETERACVECGVVGKQKAPFQMKGEPKWGRRGILQLNWVFDEFFVTPNVWSDVFEPQGVACRPVLNRSEAALKTVVQLDINEETAVDFRGLETEKCGACGGVKYIPVTRGFFPKLKKAPRGAIARTKERFGSGGTSYNCIVISQEMAVELRKHDVRGVYMKPVAAS